MLNSRTGQKKRKTPRTRGDYNYTYYIQAPKPNYYSAMEVLFDIEIKNKNVYSTCSPEEIIALNSIKGYVQKRIKLLDDEMSMEEKGSNACVVIYIMKKPRAIQPRKYSDILTKKILASFNENDMILMWKSVDENIKRFLN